MKIAPPAIEVRFLGACDGCAASMLTFHAGFKKTVMDACLEITEVNQVKGAGGTRGTGYFVSPFAVGDWPAAGTLGDIPDHGIRTLNAGGVDVILFRRGAAVTCFEDACSHIGLGISSGTITKGGDHLSPSRVPLRPCDRRMSDGAGRAAALARRARQRQQRRDPARRLVMRVSLAQKRLPPRGCGPQHDPPARPLLVAGGPRAILGCRSGDGAGATGALVAPIAPRADTLFGPREACLAARGGPLYVCESGHHRLLIWNEMPAADRMPADLVIGQADFWREGRNAKRDIGPATLNVPTGVATSPGVLAVADAWNHRVLLWHGHPRRSNRPADVVLGEADFGGSLANRGFDCSDSGTLNWCYGIDIVGERLFVADTGNRRVLVWHRIPVNNGSCADVVLGQRDFTTRDENAGEGAGPLWTRSPHGVAVLGQAVLVADAGNNRINVWRSLPQANDMACDFVLGQAGMAGLITTAPAMIRPRARSTCRMG